MFLILILALTVSNQLPEKYSKYFNFTTHIGTTTYNISNCWIYKFHYLNGGVQGQFSAETDNAKLIYSSNIERGTITFQLYNNADSLIATFPASNVVDTLMGIFEKGEKYEIRATATDAKGRFDFRME